MEDKNLEHRLQALNNSTNLFSKFKESIYTIVNQLLDTKPISAISFFLTYFICDLQVFYFLWNTEVLLKIKYSMML